MQSEFISTPTMIQRKKKQCVSFRNAMAVWFGGRRTYMKISATVVRILVEVNNEKMLIMV